MFQSHWTGTKDRIIQEIYSKDQLLKVCQEVRADHRLPRLTTITQQEDRNLPEMIFCCLHKRQHRMRVCKTMTTNTYSAPDHLAIVLALRQNVQKVQPSSAHHLPQLNQGLHLVLVVTQPYCVRSTLLVSVSVDGLEKILCRYLHIMPHMTVLKK